MSSHVLPSRLWDLDLFPAFRAHPTPAPAEPIPPIPGPLRLSSGHIFQRPCLKLRTEWQGALCDAQVLRIATWIWAQIFFLDFDVSLFNIVYAMNVVVHLFLSYFDICCFCPGGAPLPLGVAERRAVSVGVADVAGAQPSGAQRPLRGVALAAGAAQPGIRRRVHGLWQFIAHRGDDTCNGTTFQHVTHIQLIWNHNIYTAFWKYLWIQYDSNMIQWALTSCIFFIFWSRSVWTVSADDLLVLWILRTHNYFTSVDSSSYYIQKAWKNCSYCLDWDERNDLKIIVSTWQRAYSLSLPAMVGRNNFCGWYVGKHHLPFNVRHIFGYFWKMLEVYWTNLEARATTCCFLLRRAVVASLECLKLGWEGGHEDSWGIIRIHPTLQHLLHTHARTHTHVHIYIYNDRTVKKYTHNDIIILLYMLAPRIQIYFWSCLSEFEHVYLKTDSWKFTYWRRTPRYTRNRTHKFHHVSPAFTLV